MHLTTGPNSAVINGLEQHFHVYGSGPLIIAHPGGPGISWEYLRMTQLEETATVLYVEPIGTGSSARLAEPAEYTTARYAEQMLGIANHLGLDRVTILGHSAGGFAAQRFALEYPDRIESLILYDTSARTDGEFGAEIGRQLGLFAEQHRGDPRADATLAAWMRQASVTDDAGMTQLLRDVLPLYVSNYWHHEEQFAPMKAAVQMWLAPQQSGEQFDVRDRLPQIAAPALVIVGTDDFICGPRWAAELADLLQSATVSTFDETGHFAHLEKTEEFTAAVTNFLRA